MIHPFSTTIFHHFIYLEIHDVRLVLNTNKSKMPTPKEQTIDSQGNASSSIRIRCKAHHHCLCRALGKVSSREVGEHISMTLQRKQPAPGMSLSSTPIVTGHCFHLTHTHHIRERDEGAQCQSVMHYLTNRCWVATISCCR